jgi:hypothetical protein
MQRFAKEVVSKVTEIDEEKLKTEKALHDFLPVSVVSNMRTQKGNETTDKMAESFDCVTIFYGEVEGLDELISDCSAEEVDEKIESFLFFNQSLSKQCGHRISIWPLQIQFVSTFISVCVSSQ